MEPEQNLRAAIVLLAQKYIQIRAQLADTQQLLGRCLHHEPRLKRDVSALYSEIVANSESEISTQVDLVAQAPEDNQAIATLLREIAGRPTTPTSEYILGLKREAPLGAGQAADLARKYRVPDTD